LRTRSCRCVTPAPSPLCRSPHRPFYCKRCLQTLKRVPAAHARTAQLLDPWWFHVQDCHALLLQHACSLGEEGAASGPDAAVEDAGANPQPLSKSEHALLNYDGFCQVISQLGTTADPCDRSHERGCCSALGWKSVDARWCVDRVSQAHFARQVRALLPAKFEHYFDPSSFARSCVLRPRQSSHESCANRFLPSWQGLCCEIRTAC
jgi:hypothetical protein